MHELLDMSSATFRIIYDESLESLGHYHQKSSSKSAFTVLTFNKEIIHKIDYNRSDCSKRDTAIYSLEIT